VKEGRDKQKPRPSGIRRFSCQEIKELRNANGSIRNLASQLNVSHSLLKDIRKYRLYKDCN
jgi:DNA-binding transcriptional regulator YiaG